MNTDYADHSKGAKDLIKFGIDIYCPKQTATVLNLNGHRLHIIEPLKQFKINEWTIKPIPLIHDVENMGFLIAKGSEKLLYACDTSFIPNRFRGLSFIMLGVNHDTKILANNIARGYLHPEAGKRILRHHMSLNTAKGFFKANDMGKVEEIHLIHLSETNSHAEKFKKEIQQLIGKPVYV